MTSTNPITEDRPLAWTTPDGRYTIAVTRTVEAYAVTVENAAGFRIDTLARTHAAESAARDLARLIATMLRDGATVAEVVAAIQPGADVIAAAEQLLRDAIPTPRLAPAAKGTVFKVSDAGLRLLGRAIADPNGVVRLGSGASVTMLRAYARRGLLRPIYRIEGLRRRLVAGEITPMGRRLHAEKTATVATITA